MNESLGTEFNLDQLDKELSSLLDEQNSMDNQWLFFIFKSAFKNLNSRRAIIPSNIHGEISK